MWMPSICTTMMSSPDRSAPIHSFMRAADNATKCREAAHLGPRRHVRRESTDEDVARKVTKNLGISGRLKKTSPQ
jgi:hypothetical protein